MANRISTEDVARAAQLARLRLSEDELSLYTGQLAAVLAHAADVEALDTSGVEPTAHPLPVVNVFRPDVVRASLPVEEVLQGAPETEGMRFSVPRILGEAP